MRELDDDHGGAGDPVTVAAAVPDDSPLARIRRQRARVLDDVDTLHVHVPRTDDPAIYVAYRPVDPDAAAEGIEKRRKQAKARKGRQQKSDGPGPVVLANADLLVESCVGIYYVDDDDKEHGLADSNQDDWPKFGDPRFWAAYGISDEVTTAVQACVRLFATEADLVMHAGQLIELSGFDKEQLQERFQGE